MKLLTFTVFYQGFAGYNEAYQSIKNLLGALELKYTETLVPDGVRYAIEGEYNQATVMVALSNRCNRIDAINAYRFSFHKEPK